MLDLVDRQSDPAEAGAPPFGFEAGGGVEGGETAAWGRLIELDREYWFCHA